jgi:3'-5' exonuclease
MKALNKYKQLNPETDTLPLLVFDIETVRSHEVLPESGPVFEAWKYKRRKENEVDYETLSLSFSTMAPLYAAFTQVIAASFGYFRAGKVYMKSFYGADEKVLLEEIAKFLNDKKVDKQFTLSGFAISGYDYPILSKRYLSNGLSIPNKLDNSGLKPWEVDSYDLMPMIKFGGFYSDNLTETCLLLGVESPKCDNIDGSQISDIYYGAGKDKAKLATISSYCNEDVFSTLNCFLRVLGWDAADSYEIR